MQAQRGLPTWQLFVIAVAIWSTTWHAILYQLAHTAPEAGVALRFGLAGAIALGVAAWRGDRLRCTFVEHVRMALQGAFLYSLSYVCVYQAEKQTRRLAARADVQGTPEGEELPVPPETTTAEQAET